MTGFGVAPRTAAKRRRSSEGFCGPLVDEAGIGGRDVNLNEVAERLEPGHDLHVFLDGLARGGHDEGYAMGEVGECAPVGLQSGIVEAIAVHEAEARARVEAHEVRRRMAGAGTHGDALGRNRAEAEPHRAAQDGGVVVLRGEDQRVGQPHAAERDGQARIVVAEEGQPVQRQKPQRPLAQRDGGALGQPSEDAAVERSVGEIGGADGGGHVSARIPNLVAPRSNFRCRQMRHIGSAHDLQGAKP